MRRFAVDEDLAFVRLKIAREDMHERGLARAVLADDGVNFAGPKAHVDMIERKNARDANEARRQAMRELLYRKDS